MSATSTRRRRASIAAGLALVIGLGAAAVAVSPTQSAWTDATHTSTVVTSGEWSAPVAANTCRAWNQNGREVTCTVSRIWFTTWSESSTRRAREYHVDFSAPSGKTITFSVDLRSATTTSAPESPAWSWTNAGVASSGQFTPAAGWNCSSLPAVSGQAHDWQSSIYFHVYEDRTMYPTMCR